MSTKGTNFIKQLKRLNKGWPSDGGPFSPGVRKAIHAWENGKALGLEKAVMDETLTSAEIADFVATLSRASVHWLAYTAQDTDLMSTMYEFIIQGCNFENYTFVTLGYTENNTQPVVVKGICFSLPKNPVIEKKSTIL